MVTHTNSSRAVRRPAVLALLVAAAVTSAATPAGATYPGTPGDIAFGMDDAGNVDVYTVEPDGQSVTRLTHQPGFDACPAYAPRGRRIAFCSLRDEALEIWVMKANGYGEVQVTDLDGWATFPDFSPAGGHIAFSWSPTPQGIPDIWRVGSAGRDPHPLTETPDVAEVYPVHQPGTGRILFLRSAAGQTAPGAPGAQLWVMDADGTGQRQLTFDETDKQQLHDWSPDGEMIAYVADGDIWTMRADGTEQRRVAETPDMTEVGATWSPDGEWLVFMVGEDRRTRVMRPDGTDVRVLPATGAQFVPAWQPLAPFPHQQ